MIHVGTVYEVTERVVESVGRFTYVRPLVDGPEPWVPPYYVARCPCGWSGPHRRPTGTDARDAQARAAREDARAHVDEGRYAV